jgi:hypothetical protein
MSQIETSLEQELRVVRADLATKIAESKSELLRWMFVFGVGQVASTVAVIKRIK